jgi:FkbM family methyltransferase
MPDTQIEHLAYTLHEYTTSNYFIEVINKLKNNNIKTFIDLGANVGGVSDILLKNIESIEKGYLIEPQKDNFKFLFERYKNNKKTVCLNCGIYYGKTVANFFRCDLNVGGYTVVKNNDTFSQIEDTCQLFELEFFNFNSIDFLKMDVEGAEFNIIEHSSFLKTIKFLEIEIHFPQNEEFFKNNFPNHDIIFSSNDNHVFLERKN